MLSIASIMLAITPLAVFAAPGSPPTQRGMLNDVFEDYKLNEFWLYSDYEDGGNIGGIAAGNVRGIRALEGPNVTCSSAKASRIWYKGDDLSGQILGSRFHEPGVGPSVPHALELHTDRVHFTIYNSRGPWNIYDTGEKVNGKCKEDTSGTFECGEIQGQSLFKCVGWAPPYNLLGMN